VAILLTDGWLGLGKGNKNPSVGLQLKKSSESLIELFVKTLRELVTAKPLSRMRTARSSGTKKFEQLQIRTVAHPQFHQFVEAFGGHGRNKTVPSVAYLMQVLTWQSLAVIIMCDGSRFLGYCSALQTFILRFSGEDVNKTFKDFVEKVLFNNPMEEIVEDIRLTSVESQMFCMPSAYASAEDFINAIEKLRQVQQRSLPKVEVKQGTLYIGGKTGNNSIRIIALKSQTGNIESLCLTLKAKGPVAEKIGNLFRSNPQAKFEDVLAFHILNTLNSIASTPFLELFKQDFVKLYAVGSILLQQNTEKQVFSPAGTYVSRSLKGITNKLYSNAHSAEVQELVIEWVRMLVINQKFITKGETLMKSLKAVFDGKTVIPTESDKPVEARGRGLGFTLPRPTH
jgi:hypothetical protein